MYVQTMDKVLPGDVLARSIFDEQARPLLHAGVVLSGKLISSLKRREIAAVYLRDGLADDVVPEAR
ncbi:hypothetical protein BH23ACT9_BH23ACT9_39440 [soil metagenome]